MSLFLVSVACTRPIRVLPCCWRCFQFAQELITADYHYQELPGKVRGDHLWVKNCPEYCYWISFARISSNCLPVSIEYSRSPQCRQTSASTFSVAVWLPPRTTSVTTFVTRLPPQIGHCSRWRATYVAPYTLINPQVRWKSYYQLLIIYVFRVTIA